MAGIDLDAMRQKTADWRYKIIRCEGRGNRAKTVVATGLPFKAAQDECARLDALEPDHGRFAAAVHICELESKGDASSKQDHIMDRALSLLEGRAI